MHHASPQEAGADPMQSDLISYRGLNIWRLVFPPTITSGWQAQATACSNQGEAWRRCRVLSAAYWTSSFPIHPFYPPLLTVTMKNQLLPYSLPKSGYLTSVFSLALRQVPLPGPCKAFLILVTMYHTRGEKRGTMFRKRP